MKLRICEALVFLLVYSMAEFSIHQLSEWIHNSPTPFHVVANAALELEASGFVGVKSYESEIPNLGFVQSDGSLIAWRLGTSEGNLRLIGAHTDSPNLRIQPNPDIAHSGWSQLGIEIYGGVLLNSWLDRDLGIAGRIVTSQGDIHLFNFAEPLARVPQLAIHLDREVSDRGLLLDRYQHMNPVWGVQAQNFQEWLSSRTANSDIAAFDAHLFDLTKPSVLGADSALFSSPRLDNQLSCWSAIAALINSENSDHTQIVILNDHEEVGSDSVTGAGGPLLEEILVVIAHHFHWSDGQVFDKRRGSWCLSADNAHAVHPNYTERHDPKHAPRPNDGPALKLNGNQRYATSARGAAHLRSLSKKCNVPLQTFVSKNNMPCGSTIGPITATKLGIEAIDIGVPQLSMHSSRELCGAQDPSHLTALMTGFLEN